MFYSFKGEYPVQTLPNRLRFSDGSTKTDSSTFTSEDLNNAGWVEVENPPEYVYPNKLEWLGDRWNVRAPNEDEIAIQWQNVRSYAVSKLAETDYKVLKAYEMGISVEPAIIQYRQSLRDIYNNINGVDPFNIVWPSLPEESPSNP